MGERVFGDLDVPHILDTDVTTSQIVVILACQIDLLH